MNGMANGHNGQANAAQSLGLQWNPKHLEIKTRSVEKTLEPLVMQVMKKAQKLFKIWFYSTFAHVSGHDVGFLEIAPEEEGQVQESARLGGRSGEGHGQFCGAGQADRQGEPGHWAGDAPGGGGGSDDRGDDGLRRQGLCFWPMQFGQARKYGRKQNLRYCSSLIYLWRKACFCQAKHDVISEAAAEGGRIIE